MSARLNFDIITVMPDLLTPFVQQGVTGRAHGQQWSLQVHNPRDVTEDAYHRIDDRPYGGGPGMVMLPEPLTKTLQKIDRTHQPERQVILMSPTGKTFTQRTAEQVVARGGAILVCGRYEGIDQRFIDRYVDEEYSLGDFVLSGGELAAMCMVDACVRLLDGVLNTEASCLEDSFQEGLSGLLDCPHYTRPPEFEGMKVPEVLMSGNHQAIAQWRREQSLKMSVARRPDLVEAALAKGWLSAKDCAFLEKELHYPVPPGFKKGRKSIK